MKRQRPEMGPRLTYEGGNAYIILARAAQAEKGASGNGNARFVADAYLLRTDAGTRASLLHVATSRPAPTPDTALGYGSERLREILRRQ